jgi:nitrogen-specific signal transduction histidine kinase
MSLMPWSQPELEMSHASRLINSVLRWLPSALMIIGEGNQMLHINERARTLLRLEASESRYKTLLDLPYYLNDLKHLFLQDRDVDAAREELGITLPEEKEQRTFGYSLRKEVLPDLGKVFIFVFSDITTILKERHFKEMLKQELFQTRKMKAMTTLISGMAEDLHNPFIALAMTQNMMETTLNNMQELLLASENAEDYAMLDRHNQRLIQVNERATELLGDLAVYACPPRLELEKDCWTVYVEEKLEGRNPALRGRGYLKR